MIIDLLLMTTHPNVHAKTDNNLFPYSMTGVLEKLPLSGYQHRHQCFHGSHELVGFVIPVLFHSLNCGNSVLPIQQTSIEIFFRILQNCKSEFFTMEFYGSAEFLGNKGWNSVDMRSRILQKCTREFHGSAKWNFTAHNSAKFQHSNQITNLEKECWKYFTVNSFVIGSCKTHGRDSTQFQEKSIPRKFQQISVLHIRHNSLNSTHIQVSFCSVETLTIPSRVSA